MHADAIIVCTRAIKLDPNFASVYDTRGFARSNLGEFEESIPDFTKALDLTKETEKRALSRIYYHRGYAFLRMNKKTKACKDAKKAQEFDPNFGKADWLFQKSCQSERRKI